MRAGINNLMLGNSKNSLVQIVSNKNQTFEDMEARQRPSKELYLSVQTSSKTGNFDKAFVNIDEVNQAKADMDLMQTGGVKPIRPLTPIEEKVLEETVKQGDVDGVKEIFNTLQKELPPPPPQKLDDGSLVRPMASNLDAPMAGNLPYLQKQAIERLEKQKEFQKKVILFGGIGTGILLLVTIIIGVILIRSN